MIEEHKQPSRPLSDFYFDYAALMTLLGLMATGVVLWPLLGFGPAAPKYFWTLHRQQCISLHLSFALSFSVICLVHLVRHWRWIKLMTPRHLGLRPGIRGMLAMLAVTLLAAAAVWGGYNLLENNRMPPDARRRGLLSAGMASNPDMAKPVARQDVNATDSATGQIRPQGRGPRWRGGRGGF